MATMSSVGIGTNGLDVQSIVSQLVALEKKPLEKLALEKTRTEARITLMGQMTSLADSLNTAVTKLASVTGWNAVAASSSSDAVTVSAVGGAQPTSLSVQVQQVAAARSTASMAFAANSFVGSGTLKVTIGTGPTATSTDIVVSATDKLSDVASKINGSNAGVTATVMTDPNTGEQRLLLNGKETGQSKAFSLSVEEGGVPADNTDNSGLSRLVYTDGTSSTFHETTAAADAQITVNGIALTSATNTFTDVVAGVTITATKVTSSPATVSISRNTSAMKTNIEAFVKAYNELNDLLNQTTKYEEGTQTAGAFQGDSTLLAMQRSLRSALGNVFGSTNGGYNSFSSIGVRVAGSADMRPDGHLEIDETKLSAALANPEAMKTLFVGNRVSDPGQAQSATTAAIGSTSIAVGDGTLSIELGSWGGDAFASAFTPRGPAVNITVTATDTIDDIVNKINADDAAGVIASSTASGALILTSRYTGAEMAFNMTVTDNDGNNADASGLSRLALVAGSVTQSAKDPLSSGSEGIGQSFKNLMTALLGGTTGNFGATGFFKRKDESLQTELDNNALAQAKVNDKASRVETQLNRKYSALDLQMTQLNSLSTYLSQQIAQWNKSNS
ncbi:flagellar filament capping protein FliD [Hylemonella sp. W303a]|uniref:flagellar filament capping protein FliD n=1 Tax=Hylemonella sp. W303a TaxID=3389873 RepID=UPI00396B3200